MLREASQALQEKEEKKRIAEFGGNITKYTSEIYADPDSPVAGNPKGDVTVVVVFDYFCGYCKKTLPALQTLLTGDSSVRVIFKEFPILGPQSMLAAKTSLAAGRQGKFEAFHQAMLESDSASDEPIKAIAEKVGLDYAKLQKDMLDPRIDAAIDRSVRLAESLNVSGMPAYLVGTQFIPGAIGPDALANMIKDERSKLTKPHSQAVVAKAAN